MARSTKGIASSVVMPRTSASCSAVSVLAANRAWEALLLNLEGFGLSCGLSFTSRHWDSGTVIFSTPTETSPSFPFTSRSVPFLRSDFTSTVMPARALSGVKGVPSGRGSSKARCLSSRFRASSAFACSAFTSISAFNERSSFSTVSASLRLVR